MSIDYNALLQPIATDNIYGEDIRLDDSPNSDYFTIKDLRNNARAIERKQAQGDATLSANKEWESVLSMSITLLSSKAKDMEVAAWMTEAAVRLQGIQGLTAAFATISGLLTQYWDGLYPLADEDGLYTTLAPLIGLNGEDNEGSLIAPIRAIEITQGSTRGPYKLWEYQQCIEASKIKDEKTRAHKLRQGIPSIEDFQTAVNETHASFFEGLQKDVAEAIQCYQGIVHRLDEQCIADEVPPTSQISAILQVLQEHIRYAVAMSPYADTAETRTESAPEPSEEKPQPQLQKPLPLSTTAIATTSGMDRGNALATLQRISVFFKHSEPHSPIAYLLDRAIHWSTLSLPELMQEIVSDNKSRDEINKLTGIALPQSDTKTKS